MRPRSSRRAAERDRERARAYLRAALGYLEPAPPRLVAVGGLSGTGKTTLAAALAPELGLAPGAVHLRSDLERKTLFGVEETVRLPAQSYYARGSARGLRVLLQQGAIGAGGGAIRDRRCRLFHARGASGDRRRRRGAGRAVPGPVADRGLADAGRSRRGAPQ